MLWDGNFPTTLGGTSVTINGVPAYLSYVSPSQINLQVPDLPFTGYASVAVTTANGTAQSSVYVGTGAPSALLLDSKHIAGTIARLDGSGAYGGGTYDILGPAGTSLGYRTVAAKAGDLVSLFAVGLGPTSPQVPAGRPYTGTAPLVSPTAVVINGHSFSPSFAGVTGAGLYQINFQVPTSLGSGELSLQILTDAGYTQFGPVIALQ